MRLTNVAGATSIVEHAGKRMLFAMALINHIPWNMADAFIDYERIPNVYDPLAYAMSNHLTI